MPGLFTHRILQWQRTDWWKRWDKKTLLSTVVQVTSLYVARQSGKTAVSHAYVINNHNMGRSDIYACVSVDVGLSRKFLTCSDN